MPAIEAGVRTARPHCEQGNSILSAAAASAGAVAGAEAAELAAAEMVNTAPQWGHLPFLPAASSGVRNNCKQPGQVNSIAIVHRRRLACGFAADYSA